MPDCDYCGSAFDEEEAYLRHLREEHAADLGPIEQRRVESLDDGDGGVPRTAVYASAVVGVLIAGVLGYVLLGGLGSGNADVDASITPNDVWSVHYHGTMNVTIDGRTLDFSRDTYQLRTDAFHYEQNDGSQWHVHAKNVSLEFALKSLDVDPTADSITFEGTTYRDDDPGTNVSITVNGEPVDPRTYVLQPDDRVTVVVTTNGS